MSLPSASAVNAERRGKVQYFRVERRVQHPRRAQAEAKTRPVHPDRPTAVPLPATWFDVLLGIGESPILGTPDLKFMMSRRHGAAAGHAQAQQLPS
jgi:hypothetical protein